MLKHMILLFIAHIITAGKIYNLLEGEQHAKTIS